MVRDVQSGKVKVAAGPSASGRTTRQEPAWTRRQLFPPNHEGDRRLAPEGEWTWCRLLVRTAGPECFESSRNRVCGQMSINDQTASYITYWYSYNYIHFLRMLPEPPAFRQNSRNLKSSVALFPWPLPTCVTSTRNDESLAHSCGLDCGS